MLIIKADNQKSISGMVMVSATEAIIQNKIPALLQAGISIRRHSVPAFRLASNENIRSEGGPE